MLTSDKLSNLPTYLTYDDVLLLPNYSDVRPNEVDTSAKLTNKITLKVPVIASPMDTVTEERMAEKIAELGGIGILHKNLSIDEQASQVSSVRAKQLLVGAAIGVSSDIWERVDALVKADVSIICLDTSNGNTKKVLEITREFKQRYPEVDLMAGNIATYDGAKAMLENGADVLRVGMGPGAICTTRVMSGMGVPQLTAVVETVRAAKEHGKYVIADGGLRTSGDITKALAAGASTVMVGSLVAGTDEAPGDVIEINTKLYKTYRGMGSVGAMKEGSASRYGQEWKEGQTKKLVPEGVEGLVPHKGALEDHLHQLMGGLRSGMTYLGAHNLAELAEKAEFIRISNASLIESKPHTITMK